MSMPNENKIEAIHFKLLSDKDINKIAVVEINSKTIHDCETRKPVSNGVLDLRLGTSTNNNTCTTCKENLQECPGHWGKIKLTLPVLHISLIRHVLTALSVICKKCSRMLLSNSVLNSNQNNILSDAEELINLSKKVKTCPHCNSTNGTIKKNNSFRIFHEYKVKSKTNNSKQLTLFSEELNVLTIKNIFENISKQDLSILSKYFNINTPIDFIIQTLLVPPSCIRPSVDMHEDGFNEDDLTVKLSEIVHVNNLLQENLSRGVSLNSLNDDWDYLSLQISLYLNSDLPNISLTTNVAKIKSLTNRIKGKQGRFRMNLSGKRVDFSGRTVISPDPNLSIEEVGVPETICKEMTVPVKVCQYNIDHLQSLVNTNKVNYIIRLNPKTNKYFKIYLKYVKNEKVKQLTLTDTVERQLDSTDYILFNRQPSLHRMSIMAHRVRPTKNKTLTFNESVCNPYNADYDGDEMNIHVPQVVSAQVESRELLAVRNNICTPKNSEPLVAPTQDFITGMYLLTKIDVYMSRGEYYDAVSHCVFSNNINSRKTFKFLKNIQPAIKYKNVELFTGKQVVEFMLQMFDIKYFSGKNKKNEEVKIINNCYVKSHLDKNIIGAENKHNSLIYHLLLKNKTHTIEFIDNISRISVRYLMERGFSIGVDDIRDMRNSEDVEGYKRDVFEDVRKDICDLNLNNNNSNNNNSNVESKTTSLLNKIREECGTYCISHLSTYNAPVVMAECGSKGSKINVGQMVACVGQQVVGGERIKSNNSNIRTLPHSLENNLKILKSNSNNSKNSKILNDITYSGFVYNSFFSGLRANEFFFHAVSGREGLVDTAVKTAETGYMQRRLMKALEDMSVKYDNTVRNSYGGIVQFQTTLTNNLLDLTQYNTASGAISAQSIGEPGTQMTLKTFHFAGVASMNITQGVPRLKEIINASVTISTPVISIKDLSYDAAMNMKKDLSKTYLNDLISNITTNVVLNPNNSNLYYSIDIELIVDIAPSILNPLNNLSNLTNIVISQTNSNTLNVLIKYNTFTYDKHMSSIRNMIVGGKEDITKNINRVIVRKENNESLVNYSLLISSTKSLLSIITNEFNTNKYNTLSNIILEVYQVLGVEAGRAVIVEEIVSVLKSHGITINNTHIELLSDSMCYYGVISGITRFGMKKQSNNTLMLASFEQSSDFLFGAAVEQKKDEIRGVSECVILGREINVGTGGVEVVSGNDE